jgi:hypothetical protein
MEFSSEQFRSIIDGLKGQHSEQGDLRKNARAGLTAHVRIIRAGRKIREIILRDLSVGGVGVISHEPFQPKEKFIIRLPAIGESSQFVLCAVCHCRQVESQLYVVGAKFISLSEFKEDECDTAPHEALAKSVPASD